MSATEGTFENPDPCSGILVRPRVNSQAGVRLFSIYGGREGAIWFANEKNVEEGKATVFFNFEGEWEARVNLRETGGEFDVSCVGVVLDKNSKSIVHVDFEIARDGDALLFGDFDCFFYGVVHPDLGNYHHK